MNQFSSTFNHWFIYFFLKCIYFIQNPLIMNKVFECINNDVENVRFHFVVNVVIWWLIVLTKRVSVIQVPLLWNTQKTKPLKVANLQIQYYSENANVVLLRQSDVKGETRTFHRHVTCKVRYLKHLFIYYFVIFFLFVFWYPKSAKSKQRKALLIASGLSI